MSRAVRIRMRLIMLLALLLTLSASLAQPATLLRAQAEPPPPTSTVVSAQSAQGEVPASQPKVALLGSDAASSPSPDVAYEIKARQSHLSPPAPAATTSAPAGEQQAQVVPQATTLTPFLVNIVANSTARADTYLTYTIFFTNTSSTTTYQNVLLQSGIGDGQFYPSCASTTTCTYTYTGDLAQPPTLFSVSGTPQDSGGRQIVWNLGNVAPGKKGQIKYTVRIRFDYFPQSGYPARVLGNTVALYENTISSASKLNEDQWGVTIVGPVFYLTKTGTPLIVLEGDQIDYVITVGNATGPSDQPGGVIRPDAQPATQVQVFDILPAPLENVQVQDGGTFDPNTRRVTWNLPGTLAPNESRQLHFSATIRNDLAECGPMNNRDFFAFNPDIPHDPGQNQYYIRGQIDTTSYIYPPVTATVTPSPPGVRVGDEVIWTIDAKNYWRDAISGVTVLTFTLPPDFQYVDNTPPAGVAKGVFNNLNKTVTWSNFTLPVKGSFTNPGLLQFSVKTIAGRTIDRNYGFADITLPASIPSGCLRQGYNSVQVEPVLYAIKTVNVTRAVQPGTDVIYTVEVYNIWPQAMNDVSLVDTLPILHGRPFVYKSMVSGPAPNGVSGQTLRWSNLSIPAGSVASPSKITLRFTVTVDGIPADCADNLVQPDSSISQARLIGGGRVCIDFPWTVEKTVDRTSIAARDTNRRVRFTLNFVSHVNTPQLITPRDFMASQDPTYAFRFVGMIQGPAPLTTSPAPDGRLTWAAITLGAFQTVTYIYDADMPSQNGVIPSGTYCNRGELYPEPSEQYGYYIYNVACVAVSSIELRVHKEVDRGVAGLGEMVTYSIWLENRSPDQVSSLTISDTLPVNVGYAGPANGSPAPAVATLPNGQQRLTWTGISVQGNAAKDLSFKARAPSLINNNVLNSAEVSGGTPAPFLVCDRDQAPGDGICLAPINMDVRSLISIKLEAAPPVIDPGKIVTYTLSLVSDNNIPYQHTIVTDTLPLGFTFVKMLDGPPPLQPHPGVLVWGNQTVPPLSGSVEGKLTLVFEAQAPMSYGSFRSRIDATSTTGIIPTADNTSRVLIAPGNPALSLLVPGLVEVGSDVSFKISLVNPGLSDLTNVSLTTPLPAGFVYTGVETGSLTPNVSGQTLTWPALTVPAATSDGPGIVEIIFHATAPATTGIYTDTVTATASQAIDQTYNTAQIIVAQLNYTYLPSVDTP